MHEPVASHVFVYVDVRIAHNSAIYYYYHRLSIEQFVSCSRCSATRFGYGYKRTRKHQSWTILVEVTYKSRMYDGDGTTNNINGNQKHNFEDMPKGPSAMKLSNHLRKDDDVAALYTAALVGSPSTDEDAPALDRLKRTGGRTSQQDTANTR